MDAPDSRDVPPQGVETLDPDRVSIVDREREQWIGRLIDLSRRNNLLYYRKLKTLTLELRSTTAAAIGRVVLGQSVDLADLLPGLPRREGETDEELAERTDDLLTRAAAKLSNIRRRALANMEEKGLETLFAAVGMATWPAEDDGRPYDAPVLLVPVQIKATGRDLRAARLVRSGDPQINPVLLHVLETTYGVRLDGDGLLEDAGLDTLNEEDEDTFDLRRLYDRLEQECEERVPGLTVEGRAALGNFSFQKMAMVRDLREHLVELASNDLIAALAGHRPTRSGLAATSGGLEPSELDDRPPQSEHLIMDADSSQQAVVVRALDGQSGVVQGPPGTGKSQTIANLLAAAVAEGKRVLFVAEKRAALEVVARRLEQVGLDHLALDLHGASISKKEASARIASALQRVHEALPTDGDEAHSIYARRREQLNEHVEALHARRQHSDMSPYEMQGRLLRIPEEARVRTRWRAEALEALDHEVVDRLLEALREAAAIEPLFTGHGTGPWVGADLDDAEAVQEAIDRAVRVAFERWPDVEDLVRRKAAELEIQPPATVGDLADWLENLDGIARSLRLYDDAIFAVPLGSLRIALKPADAGLLAGLWAWMTDRRYRTARTELRTMRVRRATAGTLFREAAAASRQLAFWRRHSGVEQALPSDPGDLEALREQFDLLAPDLHALAALFEDDRVAELPFADADGFFKGLAEDQATPHRIPFARSLRVELSSAGLDPFLDEVAERDLDASLWPAALRYAWLHSCLDRVRLEESHLATFNGREQDRYVEEFVQKDRLRIRMEAARIRRLHGERVIAAMNQHPDQATLVRREAEKKSRHLPLRRLLKEAPDVLTAVAPCWMASPLSVSQLLDADRRYFDLVVFDEASQVLPEDAVPAMLRAEQILVAGDRHQLPPTTFFADQTFEQMEESEALDDGVSGFESILDVLSSFLPNWLLEWHYRSRDESLIAFSNHHIYDGRLVTFPGTARDTGVRHELVEQDLSQGGQEDSVSKEVDRVVDLVLEHATERPDETLGVIAMGIKHARRIEMALDQALQLRPDLDAFFDIEREERFFVKNLERVQGDERDSIILSIGYGKDPSGNLPHRFGPLLYEGGERRLNVAVTRARRRMTVVSSFSHQDIDLGRTDARGVRLLQAYLKYAASGGADLGGDGPTDVPLNPFEADVRDALEARGIPLTPQVGASRYRIDLAATHPDRPGQYVLAIECDGASYHSAPTARDRDRLRQQHLEALGWRFHRIWSTDWFLRREQEIERAVEAYERAVRVSDIPDTDASSARSADDPEPPAAPVHGPSRPPRPPVPSRDRIGDYSTREIDALVGWLLSDGRLRTDEDIIDAMVGELGFSRRGSRIVAAIRRSIRRLRNDPGGPPG